MLVARSADKLAATRGRLEAHGEVGESISDAADEAGMAAAVAATLDRFGGLDILIANAGTEGALKPIEALRSRNLKTRCGPTSPACGWR